MACLEIYAYILPGGTFISCLFFTDSMTHTVMSSFIGRLNNDNDVNAAASRDTRLQQVMLRNCLDRLNNQADLGSVVLWTSALLGIYLKVT